jgi:hypothetical protein
MKRLFHRKKRYFLRFLSFCGRGDFKFPQDSNRERLLFVVAMVFGVCFGVASAFFSTRDTSFNVGANRCGCECMHRLNFSPQESMNSTIQRALSWAIQLLLAPIYHFRITQPTAAYKQFYVSKSDLNERIFMVAVRWLFPTNLK